MKFNKIKPIFTQKDKSIEDSFSDAADNDFVEIAKKTFRNDGISEYSDNEISKWLIASDLDVNKALEGIKETLLWRKTIQMNSILHHDFSDMSESNKIILKGKSMDGSLLLWWIGNKKALSGSNANSGRDRELKYFVHLIELTRKEGIYGKLTLIFDLNGIKSEKSEIDFIFSLISILVKHFPETISRIFVFPKSAFTNMLLKVAAVNLKSEISARITLASGHDIIFGSISADNILNRYGGRLDSMANDESMPVTVNPIIEEIWAAPDDI